jgi:hypothetical protein
MDSLKTLSSATSENKADPPKAGFCSCLQLPGGDGGGFHVAKGSRGVLLRMAYGGQVGLALLP